MPRKRAIGKGKLTEVQKEALTLLYLEEEEGPQPQTNYIRPNTWDTLKRKNFIYMDRGEPVLTAWGLNVAKMILGVL